MRGLLLRGGPMHTTILHAGPASLLPRHTALQTGPPALPRTTGLSLLRQAAGGGRLTTVCAAGRVWRPSLDDVQRISVGDAAKRRGTGSRQVPHRLNSEERRAYDIAKAKGFLSLDGAGAYRRERKGSPLANIWRQLCDARAQPCVLVAKGCEADSVLLDLSPLRLLDSSAVQAAAVALAAEHGCRPQAEEDAQSPFTVLLPKQILQAMLDSSRDSDSDSEEAGPAAAALETADAAAAAAPAATGEDGSPAAAAPRDPLREAEEELLTSAPIWQQRPVLLSFSVDRNAAKALARDLAQTLVRRAAEQQREEDLPVAPSPVESL